MTNIKKPSINLTNYISNAKISGFDVDRILKKIHGAKHRPNGFPATVITTNNIIVNLYDSGKITCTKSNTHDKAIQSLYDFVGELKRIGIKCKLESKPQIVMVSATVNSDGMIDLDALRNTVNYTKDVRSFPAIQMSFPDDVAVKVFDSKLVITAQSIKSMIPAVIEILKYTKRGVP